MTGIDIPIARLVSLFDNGLWITLSNKSYNSICHRNMRNGNIIPEMYVENGEYEEIIFDDRLDALCFFDLTGNEVVVDGDLVEQDVNLIFAVNLESIYPLIDTYRAEAEVHRDVQNIIKLDGLTNVTINSVTPRLNAYGDLYTDNLKEFDMHPYHTFAVNLTIKFYNYC